MRDDLSSPAPAALVRVAGATVQAGATTILDRVTLSVGPGAPTALVGPNGAGKTTLLRLMMGLVEPDAGEAAIDGIERAIVFQKPVMLRRSVAANLAFALEAAGQPSDPAAIGALLDLVGLAGLRDRPARRLSGGEQQRLAIARALARRPSLLLLDEPTASLDPAQTKLVEDLIGRIARSGVKIIFSTHDLGQARRLASDVVLMVAGRIAEHTPAATFFTAPASEAGRRFVAGELVIHLPESAP